MYRTIDIRNFRGFKRFRLSQLGRVNLLVGTNNSGKTSVLEAIELLSSSSLISTIWSSLKRRGEHLWHDDERRELEVDIAHLFHGHDIAPGQSFEISGHTAAHEQFIKVTIRERTSKDTHQKSLFDTGIDERFGPYVIRIQSHKDLPFRDEPLPLSVQGGLSASTIRAFSTLSRKLSPPVRYISTAALDVHQVVTLFDEIVLTPDEHLVVEALRTIEPGIERLASVGTGRWRTGPSRGGIVVKCRGVEPRIPIGSMGDGIWRMLGLSLAIVAAENGILLVDEIDTGLHYSVMGSMWKLVRNAAKRLNVQVFATTHSRDCYESLSQVVTDGDQDGECITIQRIERNKDAAVAFTNEEIVIAAERGLEVR